MKIVDKIKWILGILLVFVLIVATNLIDKENFRKVNHSVQTIYKDRLVAKDVLFELSHLVHEKELAITAGDLDFFGERNAKANQEMDELLEQFLTTETTTHEAKVFQIFQDDIKKLIVAEPPSVESSENYKKRINEVKKGLYKLAKIQVTEGRNQMLISRDAVKEVELFTSIEIYLMIFLAIAVQIIIMYRPE